MVDVKSKIPSTPLTPPQKIYTTHGEYTAETRTTHGEDNHCAKNSPHSLKPKSMIHRLFVKTKAFEFFPKPTNFINFGKNSTQFHQSNIHIAIRILKYV
jgi:hypothetical protein